MLTESFAINNMENDMASKLKKGDGSFTFYKDMVGEKEKEHYVEVEESSGKVINKYWRRNCNNL